MITLEDCIALCGLTEEEVLAIAEHEHLPEIIASALAQHLLHQSQGLERIRNMIIDDVRAAQARRDNRHVQTLLHVLHHFLRNHPEACLPCSLGQTSHGENATSRAIDFDQSGLRSGGQ